MIKHFPGLRSGRSSSTEIVLIASPPDIRLSTENELVLDSMLGKLAHWLRLMGFRIVFSRSFSDNELASSRCIIVTRDRELFRKRAFSGRGALLLTCQDIVIQLSAIMCLTVDIPDKVPVIKYCTVCGGRVREAHVDEIIGKVPPGVLARVDKFWICESCGKVYWCGSHHVNMRRIFERASMLMHAIDKIVIEQDGAACLVAILHKSRGITL